MHKETVIINIGESKSLFNQHDFSNQQDTRSGIIFFLFYFFIFLNFKSSLLLSLISTWLHSPKNRHSNLVFINRWLDQADQSRSGWQKNLQKFLNNYGKCSNLFWEDCQYPTLYPTVTATVAVLHGKWASTPLVKAKGPVLDDWAYFPHEQTCGEKRGWWGIDPLFLFEVNYPLHCQFLLLMFCSSSLLITLTANT